MNDTWERREIVVLRAAVRLSEESDTLVGAQILDIMEATGFDQDTTYRSLKAMETAGLIGVRWVIPLVHGHVNEFSAEARRLVGQWPTPETGLDRMIAALESIAENTDDEDTRGNARKFAAWLRSGATTVGLGVATAYATGQLPGH